MAISDSMKAHLAQNVTTLCTLWKVTATDGTVVAVCNNTRDLTFDSVTYKAMPLTPSELKTTAGLAPDNAEVTAILAGSFSEGDLRGHKWDHARVEMTTVSYLDLTMGYAERRVGYLGQIVIKNGLFTAEFRSLSQIVSQPIGDLSSQLCRVRELGKGNCKVTVADYTLEFAVVSAASARAFVANLSPTPADNYYAYGWVDWLTGANAGLRMEIVLNTGNSVSLYEPMPHTISVGDTGNLVRGCDRSRTACKTFAVAGNPSGTAIEDMDAEPDIPGIDFVYHFPD